MKLVIKHSRNIARHRKNQHDSFKSRKITASQREALKTSLLDCPFPSKEYLKNLSQLDGCNFNAGNLCDIGNSKNVYKQIIHKNLKQKHENTFLRILNLKEEYLREFECQKIKGLIQYVSAKPFVVGLWNKRDIDVFHENPTKYAFMGDTTGSIALKVGEKMILYYSFLLCNKTKNSEPLVNIEILTDSLDKQPIKNCLQQFITDEKKKYGHKSNGIPIIFTCDMSCLIFKATVRSFNSESIEEYIGRSYKIITGKASSKELPVKPSKLFVHVCLSHIIYAFSRYRKKFFTGNKKKFMMYFCSVLANSEKWEAFRKTIACLWFLWLSIKTPTFNNPLTNYVLK